MIRVLLVDDSPIALLVLKRMLSEAKDIVVIDTASNGKEALKKVHDLKPQVVCTDLHMPKMNGLRLIQKIMHEKPLPILVISVSVQSDDEHNVFDLLEAGAVDVFPKPIDGLSETSAHLKDELIRKIRVLSGVVPIRRHNRHPLEEPPPPLHPLPPPVSPAHSVPQSGTAQSASRGYIKPRIVAIGASTGGPQALMTLLSELPPSFPLPILCIQHISDGFLNEMISWLSHHTPLKIKIAQAGTTPRPGHIYFSPENYHLEIDKNYRFNPVRTPSIKEISSSVKHHRPSVDVTFTSIASVYGAAAIGILLTGMGSDGAAGMLTLYKNKGTTIAQDENTSVVYGMPKQARDLGAVQQILPIQRIAAMLCRTIPNSCL
ncbi:chemotaxis-specific protein-glutamate methyltransferase CheB [Magnetococcales bacterium HHB-1]